jgi:NAD(P)-dependent dehydrogenase (short-subunit alcohol dehydrogenase family)
VLVEAAQRIRRLVTGANRGIGKAIAEELLAQGATKVYAAVRNPASVTDERLTPIALDVTDAGSVAAAVELASDVQIVVNNAGIGRPSNPLQATLDDARAEVETNYLGLVSVTNAFAPVLAAHGGGAFVNVLSVVSWVAMPHLATYSASKAAAWAYSNAARTQLATQGTEVVGVHVGYVDTDLTAGWRVTRSPRRRSPSPRSTRWQRALLRRSSTSSAARSRPASPMTTT